MQDELKRSYEEDLTLFEGPWSRALALGLLAALLFYGAAVASGYGAYVLTKWVIMVIAALGLNLLVGYTGQISLGHAAFLAIGAYTHVVLYTQGMALPVTLLIGAAVAGGAGFVVGLPALRLEGPYLAIATLGFQVTVDQLLGRWESVTGGRMGLGVPSPELPGVPLDDISSYFAFCLLIAAAVAAGVYNVGRSRVGRAFTAIRDNDIAAEAMGVGLMHYKTLAFAMSAAITGLAGGLYAHLFDRINPSTFSLLHSIELLVMILVGGLGSVLGSILGASLLTALQHLLSDLESYQSIAVGGVLVAVLLFEPMGMRGRWLRVKYYFKAWPF